MDYDDIVIGSGLTALGTVLGLPPARRVLVLADAPDGGFRHYPDAPDAPCASLGPGGLGRYWHGVIPTGLRVDLTGLKRESAAGNHSAFQTLFQHFYPRSTLQERMGCPWLFVPWKPVRPAREWPRLLATRTPQLVLRQESALRFERRSVRADTQAVCVHTASAQFNARRLWLAAGCLHTPALLQNGLSLPLARDRVSDHAILYLGQVDGATAPRIERTRDGMWVEARYSDGDAELCSLRPARLAFRALDAGIAQRAVFGMPAGSAIRKLTSGASPALIAEALYTRLGLFPSAARYSVYAQAVVPDAFDFDAGTATLLTNLAAFRRAGDAARTRAPWPGMQASKRPELFLPGIHLHHSLFVERLAEANVDRPEGSVQVVDSSAHADIGPDHPTFKLMVAAWLRARASS